MNAQQARIDELLDRAADEVTEHGLPFSDTIADLVSEGFLLTGLDAAIEARIDPNL